MITNFLFYCQQIAIKGKGGAISFPDEGEDISKLNEEELRVVYIGIEGMHCNSCVKNIEGNISTLSGVKKIEVSLEEKEGKITYSPKHTTGKVLEKAIGEMGFETSIKRIVDVLTQNELALSEDRIADNKEAESLEVCLKNSSEVKISVKGMTCQSCVRTIEQGVSKQAGVQAVKVSLKNEEAAITYDPSLTDPATLSEAINDMGFDASLSSPSASPTPTNEIQMVMINVDGMTCNSCVQSIEKSISKLGGVQAISVSLKGKTAQVHYSPEKVTADQLRESIEEMGFDACLIGDNICNVNKDVRTAMISIEGMTCMSCVKTIEGNMSSKPGVQSIKVSLKDKRAAIKYDEAVTTPEDLRAGIEDLGFDASFSEGN